MRSIVSTAPDEISSELRNTTGIQLVARCSKFRPAGRTDPSSVTKIPLRSRINDLADEIAELDALIAPIVNHTAPQLVELLGVRD